MHLVQHWGQKHLSVRSQVRQTCHFSKYFPAAHSKLNAITTHNPQQMDTLVHHVESIIIYPQDLSRVLDSIDINDLYSIAEYSIAKLAMEYAYSIAKCKMFEYSNAK